MKIVRVLAAALAAASPAAANGFCVGAAQREDIASRIAATGATCCSPPISLYRQPATRTSCSTRRSAFPI